MKGETLPVLSTACTVSVWPDYCSLKYCPNCLPTYTTLNSLLHLLQYYCQNINKVVGKEDNWTLPVWKIFLLVWRVAFLVEWQFWAKDLVRVIDNISISLLFMLIRIDHFQVEMNLLHATSNCELGKLGQESRCLVIFKFWRGGKQKKSKLHLK